MAERLQRGVDLFEPLLQRLQQRPERFLAGGLRGLFAGGVLGGRRAGFELVELLGQAVEFFGEPAVVAGLRGDGGAFGFLLQQIGGNLIPCLVEEFFEPGEVFGDSFQPTLLVVRGCVVRGRVARGRVVRFRNLDLDVVRFVGFWFFLRGVEDSHY